ncbi:unnamed protein product [Periconia digitata]|uniref:Uncharacterized protein n=1 Tax=Periconia digitata TaxID=1303443 RepID=A0A9W4U9F5_9PLEO|nr:unnamed protein product [Periconia digitata]
MPIGSDGIITIRSHPPLTQDGICNQIQPVWLVSTPAPPAPLHPMGPIIIRRHLVNLFALIPKTPNLGRRESLHPGASSCASWCNQTLVSSFLFIPQWLEPAHLNPTLLSVPNRYTTGRLGDCRNLLLCQSTWSRLRGAEPSVCGAMVPSTRATSFQLYTPAARHTMPIHFTYLATVRPQIVR